jgi:ATP-binding cassette subfamily B protein
LAKLEALGLTYTYPGSRRGIWKIDLWLERGSFTVIVGRTGAGKTTLLRVLLGLLPRHAGQIRWEGQIVSDPASFFVPPRCVYVAQAPPVHSCRSLEEDILTRLLEESGCLPELLVFDDLSAALDVRAERALWDWIFAHGIFQRSGACLVVSNRRPALRRADRIVVLVEGKAAAEGTLEALLDACAEMRRIWQGDFAQSCAEHRKGVVSDRLQIS